MADGRCDFEGEQPHGRNHILTTISPPASIELCDDHQVIGLIGILATLLGIDPEGLRASIEAYMARQAKAAAKELAKAEAAEQAAAAAPEIPGAMGTGQVAADDAESLVFADESEYAGGGDES